MNTDIKQAMHVGAGKSFGTAEANCTVARKSRIGRKMSMTGVSKYTGRRTLSGFRYILMRAVRIFMPWLFLLVFAPKADGSV